MNEPLGIVQRLLRGTSDEAAILIVALRERSAVYLSDETGQPMSQYDWLQLRAAMDYLYMVTTSDQRQALYEQHRIMGEVTYDRADDEQAENGAPDDSSTTGAE